MKNYPTREDHPENESALEHFLITVLDAIPSLVSYLDRDFNYLYVNPAYEKWFGLSKAECLRGNVMLIIDDSGFNTILPFLKRALAGEDFFLSVS